MQACLIRNGIMVWLLIFIPSTPESTESQDELIKRMESGTTPASMELKTSSHSRYFWIGLDPLALMGKISGTK